MNAFVLLAEFDLIEDSAWLGVGAFALLFGLSFVVAMVDKGRRIRQSTLQFILAQLIFVPLGVYVTLWCYEHPQRLDADPDAYLYDMRLYWPVFALFEAVLIAWFIRSRWSWEAKALRLMKRAHRLLAEGRAEEADAAYAAGRWILDHKCKKNEPPQSLAPRLSFARRPAMLVLYFCCPRCHKTLRLGHYRVRPRVVCPQCLLTFRMPVYGETRLGIRKGITTPRYDMLKSTHRN